MKSQTQRLLELLSDGLGHNTQEIMAVVYGDSHLGLARVGARIWDLKQKGYAIAGWHDTENPTLYWYRMIKTEEIKKSSEFKTQLRLFEMAPIELKIKLPS